MNNKVSKNKEKKQKLVAEMSEKVAKAKAIVLTNYQGLTHKQLEDFKKGLRKLDAEFAVTKNTLLKRSLQEAKLDTSNADAFNKATGTLFLYGDPVAPLKALTKMFKELKLPEVKFGILEGKTIATEDVLRLATLPSREILIAQLLGQMQAPIAGFHRALNWNLQKFVMTLKAIEKAKPQAS